MDQIAKQERSRKRIEIILETAEKILLEDGIDQITIANISNRSDLSNHSNLSRPSRTTNPSGPLLA